MKERNWSAEAQKGVESFILSPDSSSTLRVTHPSEASEASKKSWEFSLTDKDGPPTTVTWRPFSSAGSGSARPSSRRGPAGGRPGRKNSSPDRSSWPSSPFSRRLSGKATDRGGQAPTWPSFCPRAGTPASSARSSTASKTNNPRRSRTRKTATSDTESSRRVGTLWGRHREKIDVSLWNLLFSDRRSSLKIVDNTLSFTLKPNNTLVIKAKLDAEVSAR